MLAITLPPVKYGARCSSLSVTSLSQGQGAAIKLLIIHESTVQPLQQLSTVAQMVR